MRKSEDGIKFGMLHPLLHENIPGQGGGERESGVAKQGSRPGQGGDKRDMGRQHKDKTNRPGHSLDQPFTRRRRTAHGPPNGQGLRGQGAANAGPTVAQRTRPRIRRRKPTHRSGQGPNKARTRRRRQGRRRGSRYCGQRRFSS